MTNTNAELPHENGGATFYSINSQSGSQDHPQRSQIGSRNLSFKSGPLFVPSKGIGWTSWKKRWFVLTPTSLVFFKHYLYGIPHMGNEINITLGGFDLNNSIRVVIKEDKKLLTIQFPDARDGREFTLKAATVLALYEWKIALDNAIALAPSATNVTEQNAISRNNQKDSNRSSCFIACVKVLLNFFEKIYLKIQTDPKELLIMKTRLSLLEALRESMSKQIMNTSKGNGSSK